MLQAIWDILCESAVFILVGFAIAGALHVLVPTAGVIRLLSAARSRSVVLASLIGLPLPLCSCSVLPAAVTLRKKGASKGATLSFLISTPETSMTSVLLTYGLLGPTMAIFRPIAASITALAAGVLENFVERRYPVPEPTAAPDEPSACGCHSPGGENGTTGESAEWRGRASDAIQYAFKDLFDSIFGWVLLGIVAAAFIQTILPDVVFHTIFRGSFQSMLVMVVLGIPLYVCAEASTPIAAAFMLQGISPGAALVLLLVGPATNIGSLGVLKGLLGRRTIVIYLLCIIGVALVMGALLDNLLAQSQVAPGVRVLDEPFVPQSVKGVAAVVFLALSAVSMRRLRIVPRVVGWLNGKLPIRVTGLGLACAIGTLAAALYLASGFFAIQPGEVGMVKRFGAVSREYVPPGLHYAWPYPIDAVDRVPVRRVDRSVLGYKVDPATGRFTYESDTDESWSVVGDENIADIKTAVHWGADEGRRAALRFQYGVDDRAGLVRRVVQGAMREVLGGHSINYVFTKQRRAAEDEIMVRAQQRLDAYDTGIRIRAFHFLDAHAPADVHEAFRDVAGAMEDKAARINEALAEEARIVPEARGKAQQGRQEAQGYAHRVVDSARGEADRFLDILSVYQDWPDITCSRLYFETLDEVLPGVPKYVKPPERGSGEVEIWFVGREAVRELPKLAP
ncbi:MAG: SO_0444 family Cu/Zn efflux transporter [Phycisphaerales bacterium]|nr:MAG: SO_0444 family Cu/Zn efflux transporter [Phycisphaerales bacterium]